MDKYNIAGPLLGSLKVQKNLVGGDSDVLFFEDIVGMDFANSLTLANHAIGMYELRAKDPFTIFKGQNWFENVKNRIRYENNEIPFEDSGFKILPRLEDYCFDSNFDYPNCKLGIYNTTANYTVKVQKNSYFLNETYDLISDYNITANMTQFYNMTEHKDYLDFQNPGVPILNILFRSLKTIKQIYFNKDLNKAAEKKQFTKPYITYSNGDSTVPLFSAIIPNLKWIWEFNQKKKNAKPVKIVDFCSHFNEKYNPYDKTEGDKEFKFLKNDFFGIQCDCIGIKSVK